MFLLLKLVLAILLIDFIFKTPLGARIEKFLPVPFWIYFVPMLLGLAGIIPRQSPVYDQITRLALPTAVVLMLIGSPVTNLFKMGPTAFKALLIGTGSIFAAQIAVFVALKPFLPDYGWQAVGALMGTWIGGSANMLAVKEILQMPDSAVGPLILVDAMVSYGWMALLIFGAGAQAWMNRRVLRAEADFSYETALDNSHEKPLRPLWFGVVPSSICFLVGIGVSFLAKAIAPYATILPATGWALLFASAAAILLALTPLNRLREWRSQTMGMYALYLVLVTIGAKTNLNTAFDSPVFLVYGILVVVLHGVLAILLGRFFRVPLFLLATSSQANIGGSVSAPIVAEVYRAGTTPIAILMAVAGAVMGTYLGVLGGYICRFLSHG